MTPTDLAVRASVAVVGLSPVIEGRPFDAEMAESDLEALLDFCTATLERLKAEDPAPHDAPPAELLDFLGFLERRLQ